VYSAHEKEERLPCKETEGHGNKEEESRKEKSVVLKVCHFLVMFTHFLTYFSEANQNI